MNDIAASQQKKNDIGVNDIDPNVQTFANPEVEPIPFARSNTAPKTGIAGWSKSIVQRKNNDIANNSEISPDVYETVKKMVPETPYPREKNPPAPGSWV